MEPSTLLAFALSFFLIALSPGLCMTLSMTLGMSIGVRRTLWMMAGELAGISVVGIAALVGVASLLIKAPAVFAVAKYLGALYLLWSAWGAWRSRIGRINSSGQQMVSHRGLVLQGFVTATSNPKAWVFFASLLPPFINPQQALLPQAVVLLSMMVVLEFISLLIYAQGGRVLQKYLSSRGLDQWLNRISAVLMAMVAIWLISL